uniref:Uncharacterized protein n=1 Tax=Chondria sp. (in: red algae) TaxID=1982705 RepID=A0A1Z1MDT5_9FLOR|nr:hypothetical protein [Chondria sp. (in: red algae)]
MMIQCYNYIYKLSLSTNVSLYYYHIIVVLFINVITFINVIHLLIRYIMQFFRIDMIN